MSRRWCKFELDYPLPLGVSFFPFPKWDVGLYYNPAFEALEGENESYSIPLCLNLTSSLASKDSLKGLRRLEVSGLLLIALSCNNSLIYMWVSFCSFLQGSSSKLESEQKLEFFLFLFLAVSLLSPFLSLLQRFLEFYLDYLFDAPGPPRPWPGLACGLSSFLLYWSIL